MKLNVTHNLQATTVSTSTYINMFFKHENMQFIVDSIVYTNMYKIDD